jgi:hypothetical protein
MANPRSMSMAAIRRVATPPMVAGSVLEESRLTPLSSWK